MRLQKVRVTDFRSIDDSGEFEVEEVTCLVGKNEAGKSAILMALAALNPNDATPVTLDKERDYPRRNLVHYKQNHKEEDAVVACTTWELDDEVQQEIVADFGENTLDSPLVEVSRRYGNEVEVSVEFNETAAVQHLLERSALNASELSALKNPKTVSELIETLRGLSPLEEKHSRLLQELTEYGHPRTRLESYVINALPSFMYISSYDRMDGAIQIEEIANRVQDGRIQYEEFRGARLFVEFLDFAGVPLNEITEVTTYETFNALLQAASTNITDQVLEYWSQNPHLDVEVRIDEARPGDSPPFNTGTIARARIKNNLHRVDTPFSERSAGFVWFFSFLVKFAQVREAGGPVILLLDEPGLSLHGKAQSDLLRFIDDKLAPYHQVIYSTHSMFMVPADKLQRVRIVEDRVDRESTPPKSYGTKVSQDILEVEEDSLFPLQGALGIEATQSLFIGAHTLLVEGPSDILYLQALSNALEALDRTSLDSRWTICPAGGIDKIMPFVSLFAGNSMQVAVLSDYAYGAKGKAIRIRESDILKAGHFYTVADFLSMQEADIEDIFDSEIFAEIVNRSYGLPESLRVTTDALGRETSTTRLVKKVEALFRTMPDCIPAFSHYTPAAWLIRNQDFLNRASEKNPRTLSIAERIFETFNSLLE